MRAHSRCNQEHFGLMLDEVLALGSCYRARTSIHSPGGALVWAQEVPAVWEQRSGYAPTPSAWRAAASITSSGGCLPVHSRNEATP